MVTIRPPLSVDAALAAILERIPVLEPEMVLLDEALGRVLAEDVYADLNVPPFDNSAMDGYAVIAADTAGASADQPAVLRVIADLPAGYLPEGPVAPGGAGRVMTRAPMAGGGGAPLGGGGTAR